MRVHNFLLAQVKRPLLIFASVILWTGFEVSILCAQESPAPRSDVFADRPRIDVSTSITLEEARVIIEAAAALVRQEKGHAAIVVVDDNGNLVSMDRMNGTSSFFQRFAVGKAVGAVALQVSTAETFEAYKTNPQRFLSALSMLQGEVLLIPGGFPLIVDGRVVGGVGSAGHRGDGDVRAAKAGLAAWEKLGRSTKSSP
jgi:glc operon protein GlcG